MFLPQGPGLFPLSSAISFSQALRARIGFALGPRTVELALLTHTLSVLYGSRSCRGSSFALLLQLLLLSCQNRRWVGETSWLNKEGMRGKSAQIICYLLCNTNEVRGETNADVLGVHSYRIL
jgi:hypothetical protein